VTPVGSQPRSPVCDPPPEPTTDYTEMPKRGYVSPSVTKALTCLAERELSFPAGWLEGVGCLAEWSTRKTCYRSVAQAVTVNTISLPSVLPFI